MNIQRQKTRANVEITLEYGNTMWNTYRSAVFKQMHLASCPYWDSGQQISSASSNTVLFVKGVKTYQTYQYLSILKTEYIWILSVLIELLIIISPIPHSSVQVTIGNVDPSWLHGAGTWSQQNVKRYDLIWRRAKTVFFWRWYNMVIIWYNKLQQTHREKTSG